MGAYYFYVNESRRQYFCVDPEMVDVKSYALGRNIGSRALSYLLLGEFPSGLTDDDTDPLIGSWIGDHIYVTTDDSCSNWSEIKDSYEDVGQQIIELIVRLQPWDLIEYGGVDWLLFALRHNGEVITFSGPMKARLLDTLRRSHQQQPSDELSTLIATLRDLSFPKDDSQNGEGQAR